MQDPEVSDQSPTPDQAPERIPAPRKRRRWRAFVWTLAVLALLLAGIAGGLYSLRGTPIEAPDWLRSRVEARVNAQIGAGRVSLDRIVLVVDDSGIPRVTLRNVGLYDGGGAEIARLNDVRASLSLAGLREGKLLATALRLTGAQVVLRRAADGTLGLSFGGGWGSAGNSPAQLLDGLDKIFETEPFSAIARLSADDLTITVEDARTARIWTVTGGTLSLTHDADAVDATILFEVFNGTEELAQTQISFSSPKGSMAATLGATFSNAAAQDIALQSPALAFLQVLNAPIGGSLRAKFGDKGQLASLAGTFEIEAGAVQPTPDVQPIAFAGGKSYFTFDPVRQRLAFSELSVRSDILSIRASGQAYLRDFSQGWPQTLLGQFTLSDLEIRQEGLFAKPLAVTSGAADVRLRLNPFTLDIGQISLRNGTEQLLAEGQIVAEPEGWRVATDLRFNELTHDRLLDLWPTTMVPNTRKWLAQNVTNGELSEIKGAIRVAPGQAPKMALGWRIRDASVRYINTLPPVTAAEGYGQIDGSAFTLVLDKGYIKAPQGGVIDVAGSVMTIEDMTDKPADARISLETDSTVTAALSLMDLPPFRILRNAALGADVADGRARVSTDLAFPLKEKVLTEDVTYVVHGTLTNVTSDQLLKGRVLAADSLTLTADDQGGIKIAGGVAIGKVRAEGSWQQLFGAEHRGRSSVEGTVALDQDFLDEFNITLPARSVTGAGIGQVSVAFERGALPSFELRSDLNRLGLRLSALGWNKAQNQTGKLVVAGVLTEPATINTIEFSAPGLTAEGGTLTLTDAGALDRLTFERVRAGGWLDAPVVLVGRGPDLPPAIELRGGRIDVRKTVFGSGGGSGGGSTGGPITLALDRLIVSEGIVLNRFTAQLQQAGGLAGDFSGRLNGEVDLRGSLRPSDNGPVIRIASSDAGGTLSAAGVLRNGVGGELQLVLQPLADQGTYQGRLTVQNTRVVGASALAELLSAISIIGLLDQMAGPGISFTEVEADFRLTPRAIYLTQGVAVGPSLGLALDGVYDLQTKAMDMQGTLSPVYFLNAIGQLFGRKGEGLFAFNFRMTGPASDPNVSVNPLSILTPGMFRDIFRRPAPQIE